MISLLQEYSDCFAWSYTKTPGLSRELVEHWLPIKPSFSPLKQRQGHFVQTYSLGSRTKFTGSWKLTLLGITNMWSGSLILCRWRRRIQVSSEYVLTSKI
jgi:hypothetical protein